MFDVLSDGLIVGYKLVNFLVASHPEHKQHIFGPVTSVLHVGLANDCLDGACVILVSGDRFADLMERQLSISEVFDKLDDLFFVDLGHISQKLMSRRLLILVWLDDSDSRKVLLGLETEPVRKLALNTLRDARVSELHVFDLSSSLFESFEVGLFLSVVVEKDHYLVSFSERSF